MAYLAMRIGHFRCGVSSRCEERRRAHSEPRTNARSHSDDDICYMSNYKLLCKMSPIEIYRAVRAVASNAHFRILAAG